MKIKKMIGPMLSLKNTIPELTLFFIGTGSAFSKVHNQTNLLVMKKGTNLLIDCGTKTPQALYELGCSVTDFSNLLVTHSHADHIGGLEELFLMYRYAAKRKFNLITTKVYKDMLWENSLKGGCGFNENHKGKRLTLEDFCHVLYPRRIKGFPREGFEMDLGGLNIKMFRTRHIPDDAATWKDSFPSYGVILDNQVLFSSDTRFDPEMVESLDRRFHFQVLFHDCQFFPGGVHASLQELSTLAGQIKKRMFLMHYSDDWKKFHPEKMGFLGFTQEKTFYIFQ